MNAPIPPNGMIPLAVPNISGREGEYLAECVRSSFVSTVGSFVNKFEDVVARAAGTPHAVATSSGTTGLHAALLAVGVVPGALVICPTLTFIASANAISHAGAIPWLFDVDAESWTLSPDLLERELTANTRRSNAHIVHIPTGRPVTAVIPVYALGIPADMDRIVAIAREFGLKIVADAAAALGATYKNRPSGCLGADLSMYSFNGNKTVTCGGGGAITGSDEALMKLVRHLTTTARLGTEYVHDIVGFNYRMTNLEAAVGCAQMERFDEFLAAKRRIFERYVLGFANLPHLSPFPYPSYAESACWFSGVVLDNEFAGRMPEIRAQLRERGVDARPFWRPMHLQAPYAQAPRTVTSVSDRICPRVLTLPCSTHLSNAEQDYVIAVVRDLVCDD